MAETVPDANFGQWLLHGLTTTMMAIWFVGLQLLRVAPGSDAVCGGLARSARTYCSPDSYRRQPNLLYRNEGRQTFKDVSLEAGVGKLVGREWVLPSHFNNDGYPDVFVAHDNARNQLFRNLANGRFEEIGIPAGVAFNGDGRHISGCRFS